ncbi:furan-3-one reductase [Seminavis robusta]|uniref:Furan-3-one reductase n=1 Tax=Seminavis robusta TaxID=568900 RepID=A0A9N8DRD5_9STRA|nr:furan-3-one reductase [Seminavis robusta]|eukprot:Sro227_g092260.1 furan-3-one reductase (344) ;mRNA; r:35044-36075
MRGLRYQSDKDEFVLVRALPIPTVVKGYDVLIKIWIAGLNPVDAKIDQWFSAIPPNVPKSMWVPGVDGVGEIAKVGSAVVDWKVGDTVLYHGDMFRPTGSLAEYAVQDSRTLVDLGGIHNRVSPSIAAATPCAGWTAYRALVDKLQLDGTKKHDSILILGGAGGVGGFAIQLAKHFGVPTIIATASTAKHDYVRMLGATHVIDYLTENVVQKVMGITKQQGVPVALDTVGLVDNDVLAASCLGYEGQMVELVVTVRPEQYPDAFIKGLSFHQLSLGSGHRNGAKAQKDLVRAGTAFTKLLENGSVLVPKYKCIALEDAGRALKEMRKQRTTGKIIVRVAGMSV